MLKSGCVGVREIDGLTIVFYDSRTVYVKTTFGAWVVFHRWFHIKRGFCTNNFKPFVKKLRHNRHLTYSFIVEKVRGRGLFVFLGSVTLKVSFIFFICNLH